MYSTVHTHTQRCKNGDTQAQVITGMWYMFQQLKCGETRNVQILMMGLKPSEMR